MKFFMLLIMFGISAFAQNHAEISYPSYKILSDSTTIIQNTDTTTQQSSVFSIDVPIGISNGMITISDETYCVFKNDSIIDNYFIPCGMVTLYKTVTTGGTTKIRKVLVMTRFTTNATVKLSDDITHSADGYKVGGFLCIVGGIALTVVGIVNIVNASEAESTVNVYSTSEYNSYGLGDQRQAVQSSIDALRVRGIIFTVSGGTIALCGIGLAAHK